MQASFACLSMGAAVIDTFKASPWRPRIFSLWARGWRCTLIVHPFSSSWMSSGMAVLPGKTYHDRPRLSADSTRLFGDRRRMRLGGLEHLDVLLDRPEGGVRILVHREQLLVPVEEPLHPGLELDLLPLELVDLLEELDEALVGVV